MKYVQVVQVYSDKGILGLPDGNYSHKHPARGTSTSWQSRATILKRTTHSALCQSIEFHSHHDLVRSQSLFNISCACRPGYVPLAEQCLIRRRAGLFVGMPARRVPWWNVSTGTNRELPGPERYRTALSGTLFPCSLNDGAHAGIANGNMESEPTTLYPWRKSISAPIVKRVHSQFPFRSLIFRETSRPTCAGFILVDNLILLVLNFRVLAIQR